MIQNLKRGDCVEENRLVTDLENRCYLLQLPVEAAPHLKEHLSAFLSGLSPEEIKRIEEEELTLAEVHLIFCKDHGGCRPERKAVGPLFKKGYKKHSYLTACSCGYNCCIRSRVMGKSASWIDSFHK
ncbi:MAG: hypothetical protein GF370_00225 [Candidatus Nealsonbacteria bacterium]|nr:hypothetical protein [Candidatus Nealsonbacteria bacterium]